MSVPAVSLRLTLELGLESFKGKYFSNSLPSQEVDENIDTAVMFL